MDNQGNSDNSDQTPSLVDEYTQLDWISVESSNVQAIAYDPHRLRLYVQFHSGSVYVYYEVAPSIFQLFKDAQSKGKFLHGYIKGTYGYRKLS